MNWQLLFSKLPKNARKLHTQAFATFAAFSIVGALAYFVLSLFLKEYVITIITVSYLLLSASNLAFWFRGGAFRVVSQLQTLLVITLPFLVHWQLDGFVGSGGVILWSVMALVLISSYSEPKLKYVWYWPVVFLGLLLADYFIETNAQANSRRILIFDQWHYLFFLFNFLLTSVSLFIISNAYVQVLINALDRSKAYTEELEDTKKDLSATANELLELNELLIKNQDRLLTEEQQLSSVFSQTDIRSIITDLDGKILSLNGKHFDDLGISSLIPDKHHIGELLTHDPDLEVCYELAKKGTSSDIVVVINKSYIKINFSSFIDINNHIAGVILLLTNITQAEVLRKELIEKNKNITELYEKAKKTQEEADKSSAALLSNINYGLMLQQSLFAGEIDLQVHWPESFVLQKTKSMINGDFVLFEELNDDQQILILGDCSGQGVSAGYLSVIYYTILFQLVRQNAQPDTADLLRQLQAMLPQIFGYHHNELEDDLMISICLLDRAKGTVQISVCGQYLIMADAKGYHRHFETARPLGFKRYELKDNSVSTFDLQMDQLQSFYLFSRAYQTDISNQHFIDQILLFVEEHHELEMTAQKNQLELKLDTSSFLSDALEDDFTMIGIRPGLATA